jgi:hypothetical protein
MGRIIQENSMRINNFTQYQTLIALTNTASLPISLAKANQIKETTILKEGSTGASTGRKEVRAGCQIRILINRFARLPTPLKS